MTLTELVQARRTAIAAAAAAVTATVAVTVLVTGGDDAPASRTGDSLGSEPTAETSPEPTPEVTPEPTGEAEPSPSAEGDEETEHGDGSAATTAPRAGDASPGATADPEQQGSPDTYCYTYTEPPSRRAASSEASPEQSAEPSPEPSPTSTDLPEESPAPPTASASSTASPDGPTEASPTPSRTVYTACAVPGRPMRRDGDLLVPDLRTGSDDDLPRPDVTGLDPRDRDALARLWTEAARGELASVPAFHDLALVLSALGAPLDLIARATQAALDEVDHTRRAFAIAGAYAGAPIEGAAVLGLLGRRVGQAGTPRAALTRLAVEALLDGCWHEGAMAAIARLAADTAADPALRESLEVIATDEAGHAVLSVDLLAWCLSVGDRRLRERIAQELAALPEQVAVVGDPDADAEVLARHGWPTADDVHRVVAAHRLAVVARVEGLLVQPGQAARRSSGTRVGPPSPRSRPESGNDR